MIQYYKNNKRKTTPKPTPKVVKIDVAKKKLIEKRRNLNKQNKKGTVEYVQTNKLIRKTANQHRRKEEQTLINETIENNNNF